MVAPPYNGIVSAMEKYKLPIPTTWINLKKKKKRKKQLHFQIQPHPLHPAGAPIIWADKPGFSCAAAISMVPLSNPL